MQAKSVKPFKVYWFYPYTGEREFAGAFKTRDDVELWEMDPAPWDVCGEWYVITYRGREVERHKFV